jgi:hypothetical protein
VVVVVVVVVVCCTSPEEAVHSNIDHQEDDPIIHIIDNNI